jgi:hypothetical protein
MRKIYYIKECKGQRKGAEKLEKGDMRKKNEKGDRKNDKLGWE